MPGTLGRGKLPERGRRRPRDRRPASSNDVDAALRRAGLVREVPSPGPEATDEIAPIAIPGEPVSETLIRERR